MVARAAHKFQKINSNLIYFFLDDGCNFTFLKFNNSVTTWYDGPLADAPPFTTEDFQPKGLTALYDSIGFAISQKKEIKNTICAILTDGLENASDKYYAEMIKDLIEEVTRDFGWKFVFLAANQDAIFVGQGLLGIQECHNFEADDAGITRAISDVMTRTISDHRSG